MSFDEKSYFNQLESIVNIDSGFHCRDGANRIIDLLQGMFVRDGFLTKRFREGKSLGDCLFIANRESEHYNVMLMGHTDTVYPKGTSQENPYHTDKTNAYGPGIADMKAGTLAIYHIFHSIPRDILDKLNICAIINSDEEVFSGFSQKYMTQYASCSDYAFVMESAFLDGSHCVRRRGMLSYVIDFSGISTHSGYIFETRNASAVLEMSNWIQELASLSDREKGTSVNVGMVSGGTAGNVVPANAQMHIEFRLWETAEAERIRKAVEYRLANPFIDGVSARISQMQSRDPMTPNQTTTLYIKRARLIADSLGMEFSMRPRSGMSDATYICGFVPVLIDCMGPRGTFDTVGGSYSDESIVKDSVAECVKLTLALIEDIARNGV